MQQIGYTKNDTAENRHHDADVACIKIWELWSKFLGREWICGPRTKDRDRLPKPSQSTDSPDWRPECKNQFDIHK